MVFCARGLSTVVLFVFLLTVDAVPVVPDTVTIVNINNNSATNGDTLRASFLHETAKILQEIHENGLLAGVRTMALESHIELRATNRTARAPRNWVPSLTSSNVVSWTIRILVILGGLFATAAFGHKMWTMRRNKATTVAPQHPVRSHDPSPRLDNLQAHLKKLLPASIDKVYSGTKPLEELECTKIAEDYVLLVNGLDDIAQTATVTAKDEDKAKAEKSAKTKVENMKKGLLDELYAGSDCAIPDVSKLSGSGIVGNAWKNKRVDEVYENHRAIMSNFQQFSRPKHAPKVFLLSMQIVASLVATALGVSGAVKNEKLSMIGLSVLELVMFIALEMPLETDLSMARKPSTSSVTKVMNSLHRCLPAGDMTIHCTVCDEVMTTHCGKGNAEWARIWNNAGCQDDEKANVQGGSTGSSSWAKAREQARKMAKKAKGAGQSIGKFVSSIKANKSGAGGSKLSKPVSKAITIWGGDKNTGTKLEEMAGMAKQNQEDPATEKDLEMDIGKQTKQDDPTETEKRSQTEVEDHINQAVSTELASSSQIVQDSPKSPKQAPKPVEPHVRVAVRSLAAHCFVDQHIGDNKITIVRLVLACVLLCLFVVYAGLSSESTNVRSSDINVTPLTYVGLALAALSFVGSAGVVTAIVYFHFQQKMISREEAVELIVKLVIYVVELLPLFSLWKSADYFNPSWVANKGHLWSLSLAIQVLLAVSHLIPLAGLVPMRNEKHGLAHALTNLLVDNDFAGYVDQAFPKSKDDKNRLRILADLITSAFGWNREIGVIANKWRSDVENVNLDKNEIRLPAGVWDFLSLCFVYKRHEAFRFATPLAPTELPPKVAEFCKLNEWAAAKYYAEVRAAIQSANEVENKVDSVKSQIFTWTNFKDNDDKVQTARTAIRRSDAQLDKFYDSNCVLQRADQSIQQTSDKCTIEKLAHKFLLFADDPKTKVRTRMHGGIEFASLLGNIAVMFGMAEIEQTHRQTNSTA